MTNFDMKHAVIKVVFVSVALKKPFDSREFLQTISNGIYLNSVVSLLLM